MILPMLLAAAASSFQPLPLLAIDSRHRLLEGVATDGRTVWVSSVIDGTILVCRKACRPLMRLPKPIHPIGITWDTSRQWLWIAADCPPLPIFKKCDNGALLAIDRNGRIRSRLVPGKSGFHPGDVSAANGNVFVGDALTGAVYWVKPHGNSLTTLIAPGIGKSAQGSALDPGGTRLIVADYSQGVASIDLGTGARTLLLRDNGKTLRGIDGLVRCGATYFGIYNGAAPGRLLLFTVTATGLTFDEPVAGLELPDPTQIAFDGKRLLIVANAGWEAAGKPEAGPRAPALIIAIPLSRDCKPI